MQNWVLLLFRKVLPNRKARNSLCSGIENIYPPVLDNSHKTFSVVQNSLAIRGQIFVLLSGRHLGNTGGDIINVLEKNFREWLRSFTTGTVGDPFPKRFFIVLCQRWSVFGTRTKCFAKSLQSTELLVVTSGELQFEIGIANTGVFLQKFRMCHRWFVECAHTKGN
jgi:hypothetical protein